MLFRSYDIVRFCMHPMKLSIKRKTVKKITVIIYVFATVCSLSLYFKLKCKKDECIEQQPSEPWNFFYTLFLAFLQYFAPVLFLSLMYWKICIALVKQNKFIQNMNATNGYTREIPNEKFSERFVHQRNARIWYC